MTVEFNHRTLFVDIESHSVTERRDHAPRDYMTIAGYSWGEDPEVTITDDYDHLMEVVRSARVAIAHNGHGFDFDVLFASEEHHQRTLQGKLFDTLVHAFLAAPAPFGGYTDHLGHYHKPPKGGFKPDHFRRWYKLDNLCHQFGIEGKYLDLKKFAHRFSYTEEPTYSEKTGKLLKATKKVPIEGQCCPYGAIPTDDPEFRAYLEQDVRCLRELARKLIEVQPVDAYARFEQEKASMAVLIGQRNGWRADVPVVTERIRSQHEEAAWILDDLRTTFDFPVSGKSPTTTAEGKEAIRSALASVGVLDSMLDRTDGGAPSYSKDSLVAATEAVGTPEAVALGNALGILAGQRSLAVTARDSLDRDGFARPQIMALQRSARFSTTDPGLTIWDPSHKDYWVSDNDDELLVEFDYSNADARAVAAMSGDRKFAERFAPGMDGHLINAHLLWGESVVGWDVHDPTTKEYRQRAKAPGHGIGYNMGWWKMAETTGLSEKECKRFIANYRKMYKGVTAWQERVVAFAREHGYVISDWGRRMPVEKGRENTQTPGLLGQNATHEILMGGVLRLPRRNARQIKVTVHDALVASIPKATLTEDIETFVRCLSTTWHPRGGQAVDFTLGYGTPARDWKSAAH